MTFEPDPVPGAAGQTVVPMGDGVRLATDIYLHREDGPWPVMLVRLPYDKDSRYTFMPWLAPHFSGRGYAFVVHDVRSKFRSEGETLPFVHEVEDGYDTLDWISAQPWTGSIGMFGESYYGFTQWGGGGEPGATRPSDFRRASRLPMARTGRAWAGSFSSRGQRRWQQCGRWPRQSLGARSSFIQSWWPVPYTVERRTQRPRECGRVSSIAPQSGPGGVERRTRQPAHNAQDAPGSVLGAQVRRFRCEM